MDQTPAPESRSSFADMADARSALAFGRAAISFEVHESDFLVLTSDKICSFESMAYRLPTAGDLEEYLRKTLRMKGGYRDGNDEIVVYDKPAVIEWDEYKSLPDVGCLRKLWGMATQVAKRSMERLAGEDGEGKIKITLAYSQELEDKAVESGMPEAHSDRERPSLHTLTRAHAAYGPNGNFQHLSWETYVSAEVEGKLRRAGKIPKDKKELVMEGEKLKMSEPDKDFPETAPIDNLIALQDTFELRARTFHMLDVCKYDVAKAYGDKMIAFLRATTAEGMRAPTINEARRADREILTEILKWVAKGKGTVEAGLSHYTREATSEPLWKLLNQQPEGFPDQGKERAGPEKSASAGVDRGSKRPVSPAKAPRPAESTPVKARMCIVCNKRHGPRCQIPQGFRAEMKRAKREKAAAAPPKEKGGSK